MTSPGVGRSNPFNDDFRFLQLRSLNRESLIQYSITRPATTRIGRQPSAFAVSELTISSYRAGARPESTNVLAAPSTLIRGVLHRLP